MINGVIWAGISAGSNQAGAIVTCRAKTTFPATVSAEGRQFNGAPSPLGSATTLCTNPTINATTTHHTTSHIFIIAPFRFASLPLVFLLHAGREQYLYYLSGHT